MLTFNAAGFYYDYRNKQIKSKIIDFPNLFGPIDALVNVPKSRIWGFEADATLRPFKGLTVSANGTYLNSKVQKFTGFDINGASRNFSGVPLTYTPKWSGSLDVDYRVDLGSGKPFVGATVVARTKVDAQLGAAGINFPNDGFFGSLAPGVKNPYVIPGYATVDARLGWESNHGWKAFVWGRNIFNKYYFTSVIPGSDSVARLAGMPATYGVTLSFDFK